jgi:hypothetical protein
VSGVELEVFGRCSHPRLELGISPSRICPETKCQKKEQSSSATSASSDQHQHQNQNQPHQRTSSSRGMQQLVGVLVFLSNAHHVGDASVVGVYVIAVVSVVARVREVLELFVVRLVGVRPARICIVGGEGA